METMTYTDERLPEGMTVFLNRFDEFVVCCGEKVAKVNDGHETWNVRASRTLEGATEHYLNNRVCKGMVE